MKRAPRLIEYDIEIDGFADCAEVSVNGQHWHRIRGLSGGYRLVAERDGLIIKIDHLANRAKPVPRGWDVYQQTKSELEDHKKIARADRKYFPEILAHGTIKHEDAECYWLIEPFYVQDRWAELDEDMDQELRRLICRYGLTDMDRTTSPDEGANWMITEDNEIMIYDFAL
jgi:hypothetical protein